MKEWIERVRGTLSVCAKWVMLATAVGSVVGVMGVVSTLQWKLLPTRGWNTHGCCCCCRWVVF